MLDLHVLPLPDDAAAPLPTPTRPALRVVPAPGAEPVAPPRTDYDSMSLPELCRVILDAEGPAGGPGL
jgi:hypothetical protein